MSSAWLAGLGAASLVALWLPVLAWAALVVAAEASLRLGRASARLGLGVRGALLAVLPGLLVVSPVLARWVPSLRPAPAGPVLPPGPVVEAPALPVSALSLPAPPSAPVSPFDLALGLATLAAAVAAVLGLGVLIGGLVWLRRYRRSLAAAAPPVQVQARTLADQLGVRRPLAVAVAEPGSAPFTVGWRKPLVAVPADLSGDALRLALAHELAHVREAHYGWNVAERAVRALFVWHPMVHVLGRGLALDRERTADAAVVRLWPDRAQIYGQLLLAIAARPSPALALGASSSTLIHRLAAMTRPRPDRRRRARLTAALVLAVPLLLAASVLPDPPAAQVLPTQTAPDSLLSAIAQRSVWQGSTRDDLRIEFRLKPGTSRATALAVTNYLADGDRKARMTVITASGERITRSTVRADAVPPPPPPPAPQLPPVAPPAPPEAPPLPPGVPDAPPAPPAPPDRTAASPYGQPDEAGAGLEELARAMARLREQVLAYQDGPDALPESDLARLVIELRGLQERLDEQSASGDRLRGQLKAITLVLDQVKERATQGQ